MFAFVGEERRSDGDDDFFAFSSHNDGDLFGSADLSQQLGRTLFEVRTTIVKTLGPNGEVLDEQIIEQPVENEIGGGTISSVSELDPSTGMPTSTVTTFSGDMMSNMLGASDRQPLPSNLTTTAVTATAGDNSDLEIEQVLQKTQETFLALMNDHRERFIEMFPAFKNMRTTPTLFSAMGLPDGGGADEVQTVQDGQRTITTRTTKKSAFSYTQSSTRIVNGRVQQKRARAFLQYRGPEGGFQVHLQGNDEEPQQDSESEAEDDDAKSVATSEIPDDQSAMVIVQPGRRADIKEVQKKKAAKFDKAWHAAKELVDSEERYVAKLQLMDEVFRRRVETANAKSRILAVDKLNKVFSNVSSLYRFHNEHLLPQLLDRLRDWRQSQVINDVMQRQAPFLKMYSEYTTNYQRNALKAYDDCLKQSKEFGQIVADVEKKPECENLPLSSHLIAPVQRVMRYHLLLAEYLKYIGDDHPDRKSTEEAHKLAQAAAKHANEIISKLDRYRNVLEVQEKLGNQFPDLVSPARVLVKKGKLMKISARTNEHQPRQLFLFNDVLLLCSEVVLSPNKLKLRAAFNVNEDLQVCEGDRLETENTFYARTRQRCVELYAASGKEKNEWIDAILTSVRESSSSIQPAATTFANCNDSADSSPAHELHNASSCNLCSSRFSFIRRRAKCSRCRLLFCKKCCSKKMTNSTAEKRQQRVCDRCLEQSKGFVAAFANKDDNQRNSILFACAAEKAIYSGQLQLRVPHKKVWVSRYFALRENYVLYAYVSEKDASAQTALPLSGCTVELAQPSEGAGEGGDSRFTFRIKHLNRVYNLKANTENEMASWLVVLELASHAELPQTGS